MATPSRSGRLAAACVSLVLLAPAAVVASTSYAQATPPRTAAAKAAPAAAEEPAATSFRFYKFPVGPPACSGAGLNVTTTPFFSTDDCGYALFTLTGATTAPTVRLYAAGSSTPFATLDTAAGSTAGDWQASLTPDGTWPSGEITLRVKSGSVTAGETTFGHNLLGATFDPAPAATNAGDDIGVTGTISELDTTGNSLSESGVAAGFTLRTTTPTGEVLDSQPVTAADDGTFSATVPGAATTDVEAGPSQNFRTQLALSAVRAAYTDPGTPPVVPETEWAARKAGSGSATVVSPATGLLMENSFVSSVGWVKPGEVYPSRLIVKNPTQDPFDNVTVTVPAPDGATFTDARTTTGTAAVSGDGTVTWSLGTIAAGTDAGATTVTLVLESKADTLVQDPRLVWKDLSSKATLTSGNATVVDSSRGPRVIPQDDAYDTARYGDRPFPVVPVDYLDRKHQPDNSGNQLADAINSPSKPGSTYNLFQEMSLGKLFPNGTVPSANVASAGFDYAPGFPFTAPAPAGSCRGTTLPQAAGTPLYPERIKDGFYQLPGNTDYYGDDKYGSAVVGSAGGVGALADIDSACGPTGKLVQDAAAIADPEIDYSDYDTNKDGVVDFFMVVFAGCGGNGASQIPTSCPYGNESYDNVWPHSSSLEFYYTDPETGLPGFTTDDQLKNNEGQKLYYTTSSRSTMTTDQTDYPVMVRVGPYNVNPETAIDKASVISHEYGHALGLPDQYSTGSRETYGDWSVMATDKSQNMDIFARQEMGWVVPEVLAPGRTSVKGWTDSKEDTHKIVWQQKDGTPYTLRGPKVHNSQAYVAKLPGRRLIDPAKFSTGDGASLSKAWWSGSGNDFGCPPSGGRNLDVAIPGLADLPEGSTVNLKFKSLFDIEWDYDYGFVLTSTDGGETYTSQPSTSSYATTTSSTSNPNQNSCQGSYGNGITGSSSSYRDNTAPVDRVAGNYPEPVFIQDQFDISDLAGAANGVLRFSYATDPGLARPGWFIDDLKVTATTPSGERVLLDTDFESDGGPQDGRFFNGGCKESLTVAKICTKGWNYVDASSQSAQDHAYYLEMRDRSGFDLDGKGQNDRDPIAFQPGLSLVYTDEAHGYGNAGTDNPPAQSPLDANPQPGSDTPDLNDAAFTDAAGRSSFSDSGEGHTDNYSDPTQSDVDERYPDVANPWRFQYDCLGFDVTKMSGTDVGPSTSDGNLTGDVSFDLGGGCGEFDYGYVGGGPEPGENTAPVVRLENTPKRPMRRQPVTLDARATTDAESPIEDLDFSWDFDNGGDTKDATGSVADVTYRKPGFRKVRLTVTDPQGETTTKKLKVRVGRFVSCTAKRVDRGGSWRQVKNEKARSGTYCNTLRPRKGKDELRLSFTGPRVAMTFAKARKGGKAAVLIDGVRAGKVSFYRERKPVRFGFYRSFGDLGPGRHTVRVVMTKKAGYLDDFVVFKSPGKG